MSNMVAIYLIIAVLLWSSVNKMLIYLAACLVCLGEYSSVVLPVIYLWKALLGHTQDRAQLPLQQWAIRGIVNLGIIILTSFNYSLMFGGSQHGSVVLIFSTAWTCSGITLVIRQLTAASFIVVCNQCKNSVDNYTQRNRYNYCSNCSWHSTSSYLRLDQLSFHPFHHNYWNVRFAHELNSCIAKQELLGFLFVVFAK